MTTAVLRRDLNIGTTWSLPAWSSGPVGDEGAVLDAAAAAGYRGVQGASAAACRERGLVPATFDLIFEPQSIGEKAQRWRDEGYACATLMVGSAFDDDDAADRLVDAITAASVSAAIPLYLETHRATITQDIWRTLRLIERHPEVRFNADLSHWYTSHDLASGDLDATVAVLAPVLERVRFVHGRIASGGCVQVDVGDGDPGRTPSVEHFRRLWTLAFEGAIAGAAHDPVPPPNLEIGFAPELLPPELGYARLVPGPDGRDQEEGDRWQQALVLTEIAADCFAAARGDVRTDAS